MRIPNRCWGILVTFVAGLTLAQTASASVEANCTVTSIQYYGETLVVACASGSTYYAPAPASTVLPSACARQSVDSIKLWSTLLQGALLSGRPVDVIYTAADPSICFKDLLTSVKLH